jgi:TPR repeat protein
VSSCFSIAVLTADGEGVKKDVKRARELYADLCDHDSFIACTNLGILLFNGKGGPKDKTKAAELLQKGCDGGVEIACTDLVRFKLKKK